MPVVFGGQAGGCDVPHALPFQATPSGQHPPSGMRDWIGQRFCSAGAIRGSQPGVVSIASEESSAATVFSGPPTGAVILAVLVMLLHVSSLSGRRTTTAN